jgi:hypothetical protein
VKPARGRTARAWSLGLGIVVVVSGLAALGAWRLSGSSAEAAHSRLGLFVGSERPSAIEALAATLGVTAQVMTVYADGPDWTTYTDPPETSLQLLLGVGEVTPAEARTIGQRLVATDHAHTIIRIMWEMNGNWFPWGVQSMSAAQYISVYRAAERAFARVPGNHFQYVWNVNAGTALPRRTEFDTYPGNAFVSNIGIDFYAHNRARSSGAPESDVPPVLAFAAAHGKPTSFPEWGLNGMDDPGFIDYVASVVHDPADDVAFQAYFSDRGSDITRFPRAEAEYTKDFAGSKP